MAIAISVKEYLDTEGVQYEVIEHPYSVTSMRTAFEAHVSGEDIAKGVVLHDGENYVLAVVPATHQAVRTRQRGLSSGNHRGVRAEGKRSAHPT